MNKRAITAVLGLLLLLFAAFMAIPLCIAWTVQDQFPGEFKGLGVGVGSCILVGGILFLSFRHRLINEPLGTREGLAITTLGWLILTGFGAIPFLFADQVHLTFTASYFEVMSGLTTTGSTILPEIEKLGKGLMFWRSLTHWIGGMGIILLSVAILPLLGAGGYQLFRAEVPGVTKDRMKPRILETAKTLWLIYVGLTVAETFMLMVCGLSLFEALCHTFGTLATGGFSTHSYSVGYFSSVQSPLSPWMGRMAEMVVILFMFLAGCNFVLLYRSAVNRSLKPLWNSSEFRCYLFMILTAIAVISILLYTEPMPAQAASAPSYLEQTYGDEQPSIVRRATFQSVAIVTTTGYGTDDFNVWPATARVILLILMLAGGCAGSTGGGMKQLRIMLLAKFAWRELAKVIRPRAVIQVKHDGVPVEREVLSSLIGYFILYIGILVVCTLAMTLLLQLDPTAVQMPGAEGPNGLLTTGFTSVLSMLSNIGPGLAGVGSIRHYGDIPELGKWILSMCMLMGRLEILTVVALLSPYTWRK